MSPAQLNESGASAALEPSSKSTYPSNYSSYLSQLQDEPEGNSESGTNSFVKTETDKLIRYGIGNPLTASGRYSLTQLTLNTS